MKPDIPKAKLGFLPTPLAPLGRLSKFLGLRVLIKRDDLTGLALGGNKTRKLEYLVGAALAEGCDTLITGGAAQSNHCRQTAAAAAMTGLDCHLVLGGEEPELAGGNLLLDRLLGATVHWCGPLRKGEKIPEIADELRRKGKKPYIIPYGGSNALGALGFVEAAAELKSQLDAMGETASDIVFPSSSGGTHGGLIAGAAAAGLRARIVGIQIDKGEAGDLPFANRVLEIARDSASLAGIAASFSNRDVHLESGFTGGGYGVVGELERDAIALLAGLEGILVDPVYTGRAFGALVKLAQAGAFGSGPVVFWHTGGSPAIFSYANELTVNPAGS
ncbi:MAG: D-cysteine desulfhydrase family protein [Spirochaetales bacterium]|nr:MAG: D-cysteine desulfhydrase family protein [Spirochaetales bacterium]